MSIDIDAFEAAVFEWVKAASGLSENKVIFAHQDLEDDGNLGAPQNYVAIDAFQDADTLGMFPSQLDNEDTGEPYEVAHWVVDGQVHIYGYRALVLAVTMHSKMLLPSYYTHLTDAGIDADLGGVQDLPGLRQRKWDEHVIIPVQFQFQTTTTDDGSGSEPVGYFTKIRYSMPDNDRPIPETTVSATGVNE